MSKEQAKPPSYKELAAQVAVLAQMLQAHLRGKGEFDKAGTLTTAVLKNVPEAAQQLIRKNEKMAWTLERVRQGYHNLINAQALPSEGWDAAAKELADSIEIALKAQKEEPATEEKPDSNDEDEEG
jgi:hypothetical protein